MKASSRLNWRLSARSEISPMSLEQYDYLFEHCVEVH